MVSKEDLISFEKWCDDAQDNNLIKSPVHLSGGNEDQLIEIFKDIKPNDWVFTTYRSHYHALLKGVDPEWLKTWILENKSIHVMSKEHKIVSSAIVGGCLSQAIGTALAIKLKGGTEHVYIFVGDMTASLGVFHDCYYFAENRELPITFIVEDNGLSTDTPTDQAWGDHYNWFMGLESDDNTPAVKYYKYERVYPHYGTLSRKLIT